MKKVKRERLGRKNDSLKTRTKDCRGQATDKEDSFQVPRLSDRCSTINRAIF